MLGFGRFRYWLVLNEVGCRRRGFGRARVLLTYRVVGETGDGGVDWDDRALFGKMFFQNTGERARQFDRHLIGHHLDHRLVFGDVLTFGDEPLDDFTFDHRFGEFGQDEFSRHDANLP